MSEGGYMGREELAAVLNLLLEAERAGARVLSAWLDELPPESPAWPRLRLVQRDEAHNCARLIDLLVGMGTKPSPRTGDFARRAREIPGWENRLAFLNRGQAWVVRALSAALPRLADSPGRDMLKAMRDSHRDNIAACEALLDALPADGERLRGSSHPLARNRHRSAP